MSDSEFRSFLEEQDYINIRRLDDGTWIANHRLMFTMSLLVDLNEFSWGSRYCYEDPALAFRACAEMKTGDDKPLAGYIARR